ncbi:hypothetical protein K445DRAFT_134862 [Daldinia sp. EC12]|nr:hypothetical protein K445DRAFT_134862 [Daldinia sp. EC12]
MATPYDIQTYLLDRANIHDTVTRLTFHCDRKSLDGLLKDVYAPRVALDYTSIFGGQPFETTKEEWSKTIIPAAASFDNCQHVLTSLIIELPQPSNGATKPDKCQVYANATGHMVLQAAKGGPMIHDGARLVLDLVRIPELEQKGKNPWRVNKYVADVCWEHGNKDVIMNHVASIGN